MFFWCSRKQDIVAQSTTKVEYVATTTAIYKPSNLDQENTCIFAFGSTWANINLCWQSGYNFYCK